MDINEINWRFLPHQLTPAQADRVSLVRDAVLTAAHAIESSSFDSREKSLAMTHLEEATFWAVAAISREVIAK